MIDIAGELDPIQREVGESASTADEARVVRLRRVLDAPIDDVWDAVTKPDRISRWFLPISGDYRVGGQYQFEGNAGGRILACEPPHLLRATWEFGESLDDAHRSELVIRLADAGEGKTTFEFEHTAAVPPEMWEQFGPGAVGVGWDMGLLGLVLHLRGGTVGDPIAWQASDEGREFATRSSEAWGAANKVAGADPEWVERGVANTTAFYAPPRDPAS
jgi:uncharacterized protein YndB with AHSA1/START domain